MEHKLILQEFERYKLEYLAFGHQTDYKTHASASSVFNELCSITHFHSLKTEAKQVFLLTPSVFNSPNILSIGHPHDIITNLRNFGEVYLIEWLEIKNPNVNLNDYALAVTDVLKFISLKHQQKIDLVGHCLGANLAIAASILKQNLVSSIILMSIPWDFSYLKGAKAIYSKLNFGHTIGALDQVPALYFQLLFFLMQPESFKQKIDYYHDQRDKLDKEAFFAIEHWQFSGHDLPRALYNQLMEDLIGSNAMLKKQWVLKDQIIDLALITKPVMMVIGTKDKIVPTHSSRPLCDIIPNITLFEYNTGHIGYLVGSQREHFMLDLHEWINKIGTNERSLYYAC